MVDEYRAEGRLFQVGTAVDNSARGYAGELP